MYELSNSASSLIATAFRCCKDELKWITKCSPSSRYATTAEVRVRDARTIRCTNTDSWIRMPCRRSARPCSTQSLGPHQEDNNLAIMTDDACCNRRASTRWHSLLTCTYYYTGRYKYKRHGAYF